MRRATRRAKAAMLAAALVLTGCATTVSGRLDETAAMKLRTHLYRLLIAPPTDSVPWSTAWARTTFPSVKEFVSILYPAADAPRETAVLTTEGIRSITNLTWSDARDFQVDIILEQFGNDAGSLSRFDAITNDGAGYDDETRLDFTDGTHAVAFRMNTRDSEGYTRAKVYAQVGTVLMEMYTYSPKTFDPADTLTPAREQIAKLN